MSMEPFSPCAFRTASFAARPPTARNNSHATLDLGVVNASGGLRCGRCQRAGVAAGAPDVRGQATAGGQVVFLALTADAKFYVGDCVIVGKAPVRSDIPLPPYREVVGTPGHVDVVDYSGKRRRPATDSEAQIPLGPLTSETQVCCAWR